MYRAQLIDRNHTAMHWHMHHDGARHWRAWKQAQQGPKTGIPEIDDVLGMPAAIVLGAESVLPYAATAPLPPGISELLFAGFLNNSAIPTVRCKTIDLDVPANADIVILQARDPVEAIRLRANRLYSGGALCFCGA